MNGSYEVTLLKCPQCTAPIGKNDKFCGYCQSELLVRSLYQYQSMEGVKKQKYKVAYENALKQGDDSEVQISLGICYLGLKFYDLAAKAFLKAIEVNPFSGVACYYESLSLLRGKRPFLVPIKLVKAAEEKLATGAELGFGKCLAALGVICKDYYELKGMHGDKPSIELFKEARDKGLTDEDLLEVLNELSVPWELPAF